MSSLEIPKADRKEYFKKWRANPENKEKRNTKNRKRYAEDVEYREKLRIIRKKYVEKYYDEIIEYNRIYRKERRIKDPIYAEKRNEIHKNYMHEHLESVKKLNNYSKIYRKTDKAKLSLKKCHAKRNKEFGYNILNPLFEGCAGHHIDTTNVINIPLDLHKLIRHRQSSNNQMLKINLKAWDFMESRSY